MIESRRDIGQLAARRLELVKLSVEYPSNVPFGTVSRIVGMTIEAKGLTAALGSICVIQSSTGIESEAQVVGFREDVILLMPFEGTEGLDSGARVRLRNQSDQALVGEDALGRVLDAQGEPLDLSLIHISEPTRPY